VLAHEVGEPHACDGAKPGAHLLHDDQRDEDDRDGPEQRVAVAGAGRGVRRDAACVVAGVGGDQPGADDAEEQEEGGETAGERARPRGRCAARFSVDRPLLLAYVRYDSRPSFQRQP